jgi:hypothetical protein
VTRYVVTVTTTTSGSGYTAPAVTVTKGQVAELTAAQVTAIGGGNLRAVSSSTAHDQLGESAGVSNGN